MKIYTVIPYFNNDEDVFINYVKSFRTLEDAEMYTCNDIDRLAYDIVENELG
jgi:hypothetical protein